MDESQLLAVSKQVDAMKVQLKETEKANVTLTEKLNKANKAIRNLQTDIKKKVDRKPT